MRGRDFPLPVELERFSNLPYLRRVTLTEWASACPECGSAGHETADEPDRFRLFAASGGKEARVWCRRCGLFEWASGNKERTASIDYAEARREAARLSQLEMQRIADKIKKLQSEYWRGYHDGMLDSQRLFWREVGIPDGEQDRLKLGYTESYPVGDSRSPAMTIPYFNDEWQAINVQYRLLQPPKESDKYRFTAGLPAPLYLTEPEMPLTGRTLVCEGAKKAIVAHLAFGDKFGNIVAVHCKQPSAAQLAQLAECDGIYLVLDPDANVDGSSDKVATRLGAERVRVVTVPAKLDDAIMRYGLTKDVMRGYLSAARKVDYRP